MFNLKDEDKKPHKASKPPKSICDNSDVFPAIFLPIIVLVFAALFGILYSPLFVTYPSSNEGIEVDGIGESVLPIKRIEWSPERTILDYINLHPDEPVIFSKTQADEWRARKVWKPAYLKRIFASSGSNLNGAYRHSSPTFGPYFDGNKPMNFPPIRDSIIRVNQHEIWDATPASFFAQLSSPSPGSWFYYTANLGLVPSSLLLDIEPYENILELDPTSTEQNMNLWIGQEGVSAACHYDGYDNINVQLYGKKKWTLFSPSNHTQLYLYPFLHFHHAQTQVDVALSSEEQLQFPAYSNALRYEGYTEPGDAIYLPAMWFHKVDTAQTSININSWVKTPTSNALTKLVSTLPDMSAQAAQLYLAHLIQLLGRPSDFISTTVYAPRYKQLIATRQLPEDGGVDNIREMCLLSNSEVKPAEAASLRKLAKDHSSTFQSIPSDSLDIWLGNHVELMLAYATHDPRVVAGLLHNCY